jgi:chromosome segregation protein
MVQFNKLRITGFKSFADTTEMDILPGLTGVIGPNGCGKSNVTESLRWVMGENSAKSMRGGGMDDVIFAGTTNRGARNFAEVVLTVENDKHAAPEPFTNTDVLEISRRIDRGMGSDYRINGKAMRASDIQLLFADSSTGANSPSIVSQGRITHLVNAKPVDRRRVLEDAAGISGLHNRRKEAEQRLRAAEKNLLRVDDLLVQKSGYYEQLLKQAKQAQRYRTLSDTIRRLDVQMLTLEWRKIDQDGEQAQTAMHEANEKQNELKLELHNLQTERQSTQAHYQELLNQYETLQYQANKILRNKERAEEELARHAQSKQDLEQQEQSVSYDTQHETQNVETAREKLDQLTSDLHNVQSQMENFATDYDRASTERDSQRATFQAASDATQQQRQELATVQNQQNFLQQQIDRARNEQQRLQQESARVAEALEELSQYGDLANQLERAQTTVNSTQESLQNQQDNLISLEKQADLANDALKQSYEVLQSAQSALRQLDTEINALTTLTTRQEQQHSFKTALNQTNVKAGYENALTLALGRELLAGLESDKPFYWQNVSYDSLPPLPAGVTCLADVAEAPESLRNALRMIGVVEDVSQGPALQQKLLPGQLLVSRDGYGWRWDGYTVTPQAENVTQERETRQLLQQRNRLKELQAARVPAQTEQEQAQQAYDHCKVQQDEARQAIQTARTNLQDAQRTLQSAQQDVTRLQQRVIEIQTRQQSLQEKQTDVTERLTQQNEIVDNLHTEQQGLADISELQQALTALQQAQTEAEEQYRTAEQHFLSLTSQQQQAQQRQRDLQQQQQDWTTRLEQSQQRLDTLQERATKITEALRDLPSPDHWQEQMKQADLDGQTLQAEIQTVQAQRDEAQQQDRTFENNIQNVQESIMQVREQLARAETHYHNTVQNREQLQERCLQQLDETIENIVAQAEQDTQTDLNSLDLQQLRQKHERARQERDRMGAINLRADEEATELNTEIETLTTEKNDIQEAIDKLRHGISTLNRDARKKMLAAFDQVNQRFKDVFTRLFTGGEAHLQLVDAEDPLEAGLEIFACPPGKKLQTLSLLSGGEQTLTATALIFAMFLTQPSPICILDEIDAALDDANVERICKLLREFALTHPTRFIVITHNAITMSYMDRLYGVTMAEKGVSKLVSVDLQHAQAANDSNPPQKAAQQDNAMAVAAE